MKRYWTLEQIGERTEREVCRGKRRKDTRGGKVRKGVRKRCTKDRDKKVLTSWIHRLCSLERVGGKDLT